MKLNKNLVVAIGSAFAITCNIWLWSIVAANTKKEIYIEAATHSAVFTGFGLFVIMVIATIKYLEDDNII